MIVATDDPDDLERTVTALRRHAPAGTQVVVVADDPSPEQAARLPTAGPDSAARTDLELVRTSARMGWAAALNIGLRRAAGEVVLFMDASIEPTGDVVTPLVSALSQPDVAVAGPFGLRSADLRRFDEVEPPGDATADVAAIEGYLLAFRRADAAAAGPLDEGFRFYRNLDIWWSLVLRDRGLDRSPRRAVVVPGLALRRHEHRGWTSTPAAERERLSKRNFYRLLDRFRGRSDLVVVGP